MRRLNLNIDNSYAPSEDDDKYNNDVEILDDNIIVTATPFSMISGAVDLYPDSIVSSLFFIIQTKAGNTYTLYTSYLLEDELEKLIIENIPFSIENNFTSFRICSDIVINSYQAYVTDFVFRDDKENGKYRYSFLSKKVSDKSNEVTRFYMTSDVFCSIKYIDNYIFEEEVNNYELSTASISARESDNPSEVISVDKIDRILSMVPLKDSTTYAIEFVVVSEENKYTLLSTFNLGQKYKRRKFKGMTIDKINSIFLKDSDQYLQIFSEFCRFDNIDKDYLFIKGKNKDNINKIFMFDSAARIEFETMIEEY